MKTFPKKVLSILLFCFLAHGGDAQNVEVKGTTVRHTYQNDCSSLIDVVNGTFELVKTPDRFQFRMYDPSPDIERKILLVCDNQQIYEAEIIGPNSIGVSRGVDRQAWAKFENGTMPNGFQWGMSQMMILAYHFRDGAAGQMENINELKPDLIPEFVRRRAKQEEADLKTRVNTNADGTLQNICFWAVRPGMENIPVVCSTNGFLMGKLTATFLNSMPVIVSYTNYSGIFDTNGQVQLCPISDYLFEGHFTRLAAGDVTWPNAYDSAVKAYVNDYRFGTAKPIGYVLNPNAPLPFSNTPAFSQTQISHYDEIKTPGKAAKRAVVIGFLVLSLGALWLLIRKQKS